MSGGILILWQQREALLSGLLTTVEVATSSAVLALMLGTVIFALMIWRRPVALAVTGLVDLLRCVPFLLFLYLIYYALPGWGLTVSNITAGVSALVLYNAAYFAELLRGAWMQLPKEEIEAGKAFGFHGTQQLRRLILPPLFFNAVPALGNQVIQIIKDSAFLVIITVQELTFAANEIQATYYVPLASFVCAALLYWVLCLGVEGGVRAVLRRAEAMR